MLSKRNGTTMRSSTMLSSLFLLLLPRHAAAQATDDCGTPDPSTILAANSFFGDDITQSFKKYRLVNVPIVFHVLTKQDNTAVGSPSLTDDQRDFATQMVNQLYQIYDKNTSETTQFANFVTEGTLYHDTSNVIGDCETMDEQYMAYMVKTVQEWQYKFHVIVCESNQWSGVASFPEMYESTNTLHNLVRIDYRAFACYDDNGKFLCKLSPNGEERSHTRWWRTRSIALAHELGHLFGLRHTHDGGCTGDDFVEDTPVQDTQGSDSCPGLLPYDRDRDWFKLSAQANKVAKANKDANDTTCSGEGVCGDTCASCCTALDGSNSGCQKYISDVEVITEGVFNFPHCCKDPTPIDSCTGKAGIDPLNNVMSYVPDFCTYEFTTGQMTRMMSQIRQYKRYIYCNYANVVDTTICSNIPCASTSSSPNCKKN